MAQARVLLRRWQRELRLRDWTVRIQVTTIEEGRWGECSSCADNRYALIRISPTCPPSQLEATVVHKLLHLFGASLPSDSAEVQRLAEEQLIHTVDALLAKWRPAAKPRTKKEVE